MQTQQRTNHELAAAYARHADTVYRICMLFFHGSVPDAEDAVQTTFLRLMDRRTRFASAEHEKAWLIVTASNICRDVLKSGWKQRVSPDERIADMASAPAAADETLQAVLALPSKYKTAVYLYYYEGYSCREIARMMNKAEPSVWRYLRCGRDLLRNTLEEGDGYER